MSTFVFFVDSLISCVFVPFVPGVHATTHVYRTIGDLVRIVLFGPFTKVDAVAES